MACIQTFEVNNNVNKSREVLLKDEHEEYCTPKRDIP
jgi:hypothetical protein